MKIPNTNSILITARRAGKSFLAGLCLALAARDVSGQSAYTWNGGSGTTGNWSDGANWGGTGPANPQAFLNFNGATRTSNTNDFAAASAGYQIYFKSGANAFNLYGNSITFFDFGGGVNDPNIQNEGAVTNQTINFPIANGNNNGTFHVLNLNLNTGTSQGPLTFNGPVSSADAGQPLRVINVYGPSAIAFNGVISDFDSTHKLALSQLGSGTTTLTASNTFTGDMTVNAGTLLLATNNALANGGNFIRLGDTAGTAGANLNLNGGNNFSTPINVRSGSSGTKIIANTSGSVGTATFAGNLFLDADATLFANAGGNNLSGSTLDLKNQTLTIDGTGSNIISGVLTNSTGAGKLVKNGTGTLYLSAANTFSGGTTLSNGIIQVNNNAGFGTGTVTANSGANNGRILLNGVIISNNVTMTTANPGTATGVIQGVDNTSSTNLGTVTINTNAGTGGHFYGPTTSGLLTIAGPVNLVSPATTLLVRDGYVQFSGGGSYTNIDIRNRTNSIGANNGISTTAVLEIGGNGSATVPTAFDLNGFNQTLAGLKNSVNPANLARITNSSATLSTLTLAVSNLQVFSGSIVGNLAVNLTGGTQVYSNGAVGGTYAYTGDTTISGGTLKVAAANLLPNGLTRGNMIVTNTGLLDLNTFSQTVNSLAGNGTVDTVAGGSPTLTIGVSNSVISTFSGIIKNTAGALSIAKSGSNTFILTGTNSATGQVFIDSNQNSVGNDGIFRLAYPGALNGPTNIVVRNQNSAYSTFQLDGTLGNLTVTNLITLSGRNNTNAPTIESIAGNNTLSGNYAMTVGGSAYWIQNDTGTLTNSGTIPVSTPGGTRFFTFTGAGNHWISGTVQNGTGGGIVTLIKDGSGTATLTAANTFSGTNRISNGTEIIANALALQLCTVEMNAADAGTLNLNNLNATLGGLSGTRNLALGTGTISVGNNNSNTIYGGSLSGNALTKIGTGALTLSGNNTYTGATTISAGELVGQTGGSISNNTISVSAGATNGVLVAVTNGQWVCGALTYSSGSTYADFNFNGNAPSTNTAPLLVNGNLAFTVAPTVIVRSSAAVPPGTYPLFKYSGTLSGTAPTTLILPPNMVATLVNNTGNKSVDLNVTVGNQLTWVGGVNTNWDIATTANWKNTSGTTVSYTDGSAVLFDDTSSVTNINVAATVAPGSITFSNSTKNYTFTNGVIGGSGSLTKNGAATLALMTNNAYSGNTVFNAGTLTLSGINPLGIGGTVTFNGGTVQFAAPTISNNIVVPNGATVAWVKTVGGNPPSTTLSGNLSGGGTINESGNINGFNLNGNNSGFTGVMNSGNNGSTHRWRFNNANAGSASAAWSLNTVATDAYGFNFSTATIFFGSLSGSGTFRNDLAGTVTLSVGALNTDATFSGTIIANGTSILALTKTGTGTFTLTGGNPYQGSTTITGGRLAITTANLTGAGAISINDAGRLNIAVGSVLQMPVGTLTLGSVTGSTNEFAGLSSTNAAPINATNLTLNGANVFNIISGGFVAGRTYPLIAFAATNGTGSVQLGSVPSGLVATLGTNVINGTNTIALTVTAVGSSVDVWSGKTSGTWNSVTTGNWTNSGVAVVYADGDNVQFDDTASAFTVTTASSNFLAYVSPASIVVSNTANTYTFNGIPIALGGTLTKAGTGTLTVNTVNTGFGSINLNAGTINQGNGASLGLGTLTMSNGTTFTLPSNGSTFAVNPIVIAGGSTVTLSSGALGNGYSGTVTGDSASVINIATAVSFNTATPQFDSFPGTVNVTSAGTVRFSSTTGSNGGSNTTFNVLGLLQTRNSGIPVTLGALSGSGQVGPNQTVGNGSAGSTVYTVGANNASTTFSGKFVDSAVGTNTAITKVGSGTLTLSGTSTNWGATTINAGALMGVTVGSCSNSAFTVNTGATNGVSVTVAGGQWTCTNLTYATGTEYLNIAYNSSSPSTTTAPLFVQNNLTISGTLNVLISGSPLPVGSYPLVKYVNTLTGAPVLTPLALPLRTGGYITNDTANKLISLVVTNYTGEPLVWQPGSGQWDTATSNWKDQLGNTTTYADFGDAVVFDETPAGSGPFTVTNSSVLSPVSVTVSNVTKQYTMTGGGIAGIAPLTKYGAGMLVLLNTNSYTGVTTINAGTVQLGDGLANNGSLAGNITNNGALIYANPADQTYGGILSGSGSVTKTNASTLSLTNANTWTGGLTVKAGTVAFNAASGIGATANVVTLGDASGATVTLSANGLGGSAANIDQPVTVAGTGVNKISGIWNNSGQINLLRGLVTLSSQNLTINSTAASGWRVQAGVTGTGNLTLQANGSGNIDMRTVAVNNTGAITNSGTSTGAVQQGSATSIGANVTSLVQNSATSPWLVNQANGNFIGSVQVQAGSMIVSSTTGLNASNTVSIATGAALNVTNGNLTIAGLNDVSGSGGTVSDTLGTVASTLTLGGGGNYSFSGSITSATPANRALTVALTGGGAQTLSGNNSYAGATTISGGTLKVGHTNALGTSLAAISSGGTLDVNGLAITNVTSVTGAGAGGNGALVNSNTVTVATLNSEIVNGASFTIGGAGGLTLQRARSGGAPFILTKIGAGTFTLGQPNANGHDNLLALDVESASTVNLGMTGSTIAADRGVKINAGGTVRYSGNSANMLSDGPEVIVGNGVLDLNGFSDTAGRLTIGDGTNNGFISGGSSSTYTVATNYSLFALNGTVGTGSIEAMSGFVDVILAGSGIPLNKTTAGTVTLSQANTYSGSTTISAGTLALTNAGAFGSSAQIAIAAGATFDVSAISAFMLSSNTTLSAAGTATAATIVGNASGTISLGTNNILLAFDGANPALTLSQGTLQLNGNAFMVNGTALVSGTYTIAQQASGSITSSGVYPAVTGTAIDGAHIGTISVSGGQVNLIVQNIPTTVALVSSSPTNGYLDSVTFTAAVQTNGVTAGLAGGTVLFKTNGVALGLPIGLTAGVASTNLATLPRGTNLVVAEYSGDSSYLPSTNSLLQIVTNHPPVVADVSYFRGAVAAYKIKISELMTNASDADGDALTVSFGTSTNGISLTVSGDLALYSNTNLVNDQLTYTVSDAFGGSTPATVTIAAAAFLTGQNATVAVSGSTATVSFAGIPGYHYGIQRSTNLVDYVTILTTNAPAGGLFNYTDDFTDLGGPPSSAYYRLLWNP